MFLFLIPYSLFDGIVYIPYSSRIRNKEQNVGSISYSLIQHRFYSLFAQNKE